MLVRLRSARDIQNRERLFTQPRDDNQFLCGFGQIPRTVLFPPSRVSAPLRAWRSPFAPAATNAGTERGLVAQPSAAENPASNLMTSPRATYWFPPVLLAIACTGCVGQRNAIRSQAELRAATINANTFASSLQRAMAADLRAHQETRATLQNVIAEWKESRMASALLPLIEANSAAVSNIQASLSSTLQAWQETRRNSNLEVNVKLSQHLVDWEESAKVFKAAVTNSTRRAGVLTNDLELALAAVRAEQDYVSTAARNNANDLNARVKLINFMNEWDAEEARLTARLLNAAKTQQEKIQTAYDAAVENIKKVEIPKLNPGTEPPDNAVLLDGFVKYTEAVELTSEGMKDYLESNCLRHGHFPHGTLQAFSKGFFSAKPIVGPGEGATLQEVKSVGNDRRLQAVQAQFKQSSQAAAETARNTMKEALDEALRNAKGFVEHALDSAIIVPLR